ncbi:MAG: DUF2384 domain-containing protein [Stenotrophomonas acidaminiphila]|nr:MAG: DUF2384 domain-containing protein [Stenotrophomonas acidaminiphila]
MTSASKKRTNDFVERLCENTAISPRLFAAQLRIDLETLADLAHVELAVILRDPESEMVQSYMRSAVGVISVLLDQSDVDIERAIDWFRHAPLIELGGATAEHYVSQGKSIAVHRYAQSLAAGATG